MYLRIRETAMNFVSEKLKSTSEVKGGRVTPPEKIFISEGKI